MRLAAAPVQKLVIFVFKNVLRHGEGVKEQPLLIFGNRFLLFISLFY